MSVRLRNLAALLLLAAAASLSWYFSRSPEQPRRAAGNGEPGLLGYYLRDATLLGTDESGRALVRIHTAEAVQEHGQGLTLTGVRIEYRDEQAVGWTISAELARAPGDLGHVDLERVRLESGESADGERTIIESPHLRFDAAAYYASTDAPVDVRIGGSTVRGVGLEAWLREDRIELKSDVHGRFAR